MLMNIRAFEIMSRDRYFRSEMSFLFDYGQVILCRHNIRHSSQNLLYRMFKSIARPLCFLLLFLQNILD